MIGLNLFINAIYFPGMNKITFRNIFFHGMHFGLP